MSTTSEKSSSMKMDVKTLSKAQMRFTFSLSGLSLGPLPGEGRSRITALFRCSQKLNVLSLAHHAIGYQLLGSKRKEVNYVNCQFLNQQQDILGFQLDILPISKDLLSASQKVTCFHISLPRKQGQGEESQKAIVLQQLLMWKQQVERRKEVMTNLSEPVLTAARTQKTGFFLFLYSHKNDVVWSLHLLHSNVCQIQFKTSPFF